MLTLLWTSKLISDFLRKLDDSLDVIGAQIHSDNVFQNVLDISDRVSQLRFQLHLVLVITHLLKEVR